MPDKLDEFGFIRRYISPYSGQLACDETSVGDDCAVLSVSAGHQIVISSDSQVEGRHFPFSSPLALAIPRAVGAAVSDLSAMGAIPLGYTLALSLPTVSDSVGQSLSSGLATSLQRYKVPLVGGDTTAGPLNIGITVFGEIPFGRAILRSNAQPMDDLWVSGVLGSSTADLERIGADNLCSHITAHYWAPPNRLPLGQALRPHIHSMMDVSDGLIGDIMHLTSKSGVGAEVVTDAIPRIMGVSLAQALAGGDDYELLFTASTASRSDIEKIAAELDIPVTRIGRITASTGVVYDQALPSTINSFNHFG